METGNRRRLLKNRSFRLIEIKNYPLLFSTGFNFTYSLYKEKIIQYYFEFFNEILHPKTYIFRFFI